MLDSVFEAIEEWIRTLLTNMVDEMPETLSAPVHVGSKPIFQVT